MTADASGTLFRQTCEFCGAMVSTLRRGRCWGCYQKWQEAQPVGSGARCVVCGERRLDNLQRVELFGRWVPMCHLCAVRTRRLQPTPTDVDGIRAALHRERRRRERRHAALDTRLAPKDRRGPDRRALPIRDEDIVSVEALTEEERSLLTELALELTYDIPDGEATRIRARDEIFPPSRRRETDEVAVLQEDAQSARVITRDATAIFEPLDDDEVLLLESAVVSPPPRRKKPTRPPLPLP